jgi:hypothetical protein
MERTIRIASVLILLTIFAFAPAKKDNLHIIFIGDSITRGTASKEQSPPSHAEDILQQLGQ